MSSDLCWPNNKTVLDQHLIIAGCNEQSGLQRNNILPDNIITMATAGTWVDGGDI